MSQQTAVLLLGTNLGDRKKNLENAVNKIAEAGNVILTKSNIITSEPVEFVSSNYFCNIALIIGTPFSPVGLLDLAKNIEADLGRTHDSTKTGGYTDRLIDIDIVKYGSLNFISERLLLPHKKHLFERAFSKLVLDNLFEIKT
ncbi:2-amino-4-hydroxy-6-hydroxymethyldihydropteridine pyrophosphokinase [Chryseobacterium sp. Leaf180]|uniref:2-amino-4-hydroxy-6- hydroxymethyldihydropteridine diphosphokinase n=1 Tax=Chryseobacterium sp. Leaf180 TaxID=1736289 RepID=UPI0006F47056|nr:2-amino-4-hydroxy-6-hydroxymethyldihydropteridine diphosphokinase [Chryseobacterium sp. Leaf180]KQR91905.1 2-amino-4-hydroxy-6-hydroxymethyldihydropteridine pyrophosphokinase [Chryseobacterium sp. Leaf180]